jgi:hypothetical protein
MTAAPEHTPDREASTGRVSDKPQRSRPHAPGTAPRQAAGVLLAAALLVGVAACGSSGSAKSSTPTTAASPSASPTTTPSATSPTAAPSGGGATTTVTAPTTAASPSAGGGSLCDVVKGDTNVSKALDPLFSNGPTGLSDKAALMKEAAEITNVEGPLLSAAPPNVKPAIQTLFGFDEKLFAALAAADYNFAKLAPSFVESLSGQEAQIASAASTFDTYLAKTCGIALPTTPTT